MRTALILYVNLGLTCRFMFEIRRPHNENHPRGINM